MTTNIPKLIFQTWKSKTDIPANFAHWSATFRENNPDYTYRLWDDKDNRAFIAKNYPWFLETYDGFPAEIYRADAVRYFFLYQFGGIYADMDTECLRPLDPLLEVADVVLGRMGTNLQFEHSIPNAIMLSKPRQEFWLFVISVMMSQAKQEGLRPEHVTGPAMLKAAYDAYSTQYREDLVQNRLANIRSMLSENLTASEDQTNIGVVPGFVLYPLDWNDRVHDEFLRRPMLEKQEVFTQERSRELFPSSLMVTYWAHSWEDQIK